MTVDVDAVNDKLVGLVNLLHVVGIDGVDPDALVEEQKRLSAQKKNDSAPQGAQSSDAQILEIIKKLQLAQADSPEIIAALKSPELRALATLAAQKQATAKQEVAKKPSPSLDDVMDDDDNYPKIGPGYSDDISVVSDLTTPTVMTKQQVAEEEYYRDVNGGPGALPPMHIGLGPSQPSRPPMTVGGGGPAPGNYAPKVKNLVGQVRPGATRRAIAKTGGAAAQRRLNYQQAMAKLQSNEYGAPVAAKQDKSYMDNFSPKKPPTKFLPSSPTSSKLPSELPSLTEQGKKKATRNKTAVKEKKGKKSGLAAQEEADFELDYDPMAPKFDVPSASASVGSGGTKKKAKAKLAAAAGNEIDWNGGNGGNAGDSGWPAFDDAGNKDVFVDNDGFFSGDAFGKSSDPFGSTKASRPVEKKVVRDDGQGTRKKSEVKTKKPKDPNSKKKNRRASLDM